MNHQTHYFHRPGNLAQNPEDLNLMSKLNKERGTREDNLFNYYNLRSKSL